MSEDAFGNERALWSSLLRRAVRRLRLVFRVKVIIRFRLTLGQALGLGM